MSIHLLKIIRGFAVEGPTSLVVGLLRTWQREEIRVSVVALGAAGPLRDTIESEVARLGGTMTILPTGWRKTKATADKIRQQPWFPSVTHVGAHLLRPDAVARHLVRETKLPYLLTEHGLHALGEGPPLTKPFVRKWYRDSFPPHAIAAGVSPKVCGQLRELLQRPEQIAMVPNGIDLTRFAIASAERRAAARERFGIPRDAFPVIATVGSLSAHKGTTLSVEILGRLSRRNDCTPHLLLCGEGPLREEIESRLFHWKLEKRATLTGTLDDPADVYAAADVVVHPSWQESFGLVVAEAAACGLPVLTRAGSGADETSAPWPLAASVAGNEPDTWGGSLMALMEGMDNAERRAERAHAARAHAEKNHSITETAGIYRELLERASGS